MIRSNRWLDVLDETRPLAPALLAREYGCRARLGTTKNRYGSTVATLAQRVGEIDEEIIARNLHKDLDAAVAPKAATCVELHQRRLAGSNNLTGALGHFLFQTSAAERTDTRAVRGNEHSRARPTIAGPCAHQCRQRERFPRRAFPNAKDIDEFFQSTRFSMLSSRAAKRAEGSRIDMLVTPFGSTIRQSIGEIPRPSARLRMTTRTAST